MGYETNITYVTVINKRELTLLSIVQKAFIFSIMEQMYFISIKERLNGDHIVHSGNCPLMAERKDLIFLGTFRSVSEALAKGMHRFSKVEKCPFCSGYHMDCAPCISSQQEKEMPLLSAVSDCDNYEFMICCNN